MSDCATSTLRFETRTPLILEAAFGGGRITSDGGLVWLARIDSELGLCQSGETGKGVTLSSRSSASASSR